MRIVFYYKCPLYYVTHSAATHLSLVVLSMCVDVYYPPSVCLEQSKAYSSKCWISEILSVTGESDVFPSGEVSRKHAWSHTGTLTSQRAPMVSMLDGPCFSHFTQQGLITGSIHIYHLLKKINSQLQGCRLQALILSPAYSKGIIIC